MALALIALSAAYLLPVRADQVAKGKAPFMTELDNGRKFYVRGSHQQLRSVEVVKTGSNKLIPINKVTFSR